MTKIAVIGATGAAGKKIVSEAQKRQHDVTAFVRNRAKALELFGPDTNIVEKDVFALTKEDLQGYDVVVNAYSPQGIDIAYQHIDFATKLIAFFRQEESPRLFFILGAGSLKNGKGGRVLDDLKANPDFASWVNGPNQQAKEFDFLSQVDDVNWVGISPGFLLSDGEAAPAIIGSDTILYNATNQSETTTGTLAAVILDEIDHPQHHQERFTAINA